MTFVDCLENHVRKSIKHLWLTLWSISEVLVTFILETKNQCSPRDSGLPLRRYSAMLN